MKKLASLLPVFAITLALSAQQTAKKYVLIEHFTNSRCSVCASKNPAFYNLISDYPEDVHHIAFHPPIPYTNCIFYLANPIENSGRTAVYNIAGTPQVALNGTLVPPSGLLLPPSTLAAATGQLSPLKVEVSETTGASTHTVNITLRTLADLQPADYRIFVAAVEKTINLTTPNGENVHHDVFRKMVTPLDGTPFTTIDAGQVDLFSLEYAIEPTWNTEEMYAVVFVQNVQTKAVLNSGTRFDPPPASATHEAAPQTLRLSPNPARAQTIATLTDDRAVGLEIFGIDGQRIETSFSMDHGNVVIPTAALAPGVYFIKIRGERGVYVGKMVKE